MWDGVDSSWLCEGGQLQPDIPRLLPQGGLPPGQWSGWGKWGMPSDNIFLLSLTFLGGLRIDGWLRVQKWEDAVFMSSLIHLWWTAIYTFVLFQDSWLQQRPRTRMKTQQSLELMCKLHRRLNIKTEANILYLFKFLYVSIIKTILAFLWFSPYKLKIDFIVNTIEGDFGMLWFKPWRLKIFFKLYTMERFWGTSWCTLYTMEGDFRIFFLEWLKIVELSSVRDWKDRLKLIVKLALSPKWNPNKMKIKRGISDWD